MKSAISGALASAALIGPLAGEANASAIVNVDALLPLGVELVLDPGSYVVVPIGIADGGLYNAWNGLPFTTNGCEVDGRRCIDGWTNKYEISAPSFGTIFRVSLDGNYQTDLLALEDALSASFTLNSTESVRFRAVDNPGDYPDNVGGLSFRVTLVSSPSTAPLFGLGLLGLGALLARRRGNPEA